MKLFHIAAVREFIRTMRAALLMTPIPQDVRNSLNRWISEAETVL